MEAKKTSKDPSSTASKIMKFIKEDHKFENWLLFALAVILLVLSVYILIAAIAGDNATGAVKQFANQYFEISKSGWGIFNKPWKVITITSFIIALSAGCIVYCAWPVFTPSFKDLKFVSWTDKKTLFVNSIIVLAFIAFLTVLFYVFDFALIPLFKLIFGE